MIWIPDNSVPIFELPEDEYNSWKRAFNFRGATANSVCEKILREMKFPVETFAQASARLGYGDPEDPAVVEWYRQHNILFCDRVCTNYDNRNVL